MSLLVVLTSAAVAGDYTLGAEDTWKAYNWGGNCFVSEAGVTISEVQIYARAPSPTTVTFGVWWQNSSSGVWYLGSGIRTKEAEITSSTGEWVSSGNVDWDTDRIADHVRVGMYSNDDWELPYSRDDSVPFWAESVQGGYHLNDVPSDGHMNDMGLNHGIRMYMILSIDSPVEDTGEATDTGDSADPEHTGDEGDQGDQGEDSSPSTSKEDGGGCACSQTGSIRGGLGAVMVGLGALVLRRSLSPRRTLSASTDSLAATRAIHRAGRGSGL